jgi:multidrug efflux pump subunit AcrA (membrane-fusion protein)
VRKEQGADVVYTIEGGQVRAQPVTLGLQNPDDGMAEVTAGLIEGASVIVTRLDGVKPGSKVKLAGPSAQLAAPNLPAVPKG